MEINTYLEKYILEHTEQESSLLQALWRETNVLIYHPRQSSDHLQGKILQMLCYMIKPTQILEIGTFTGYSAICMAQTIGDGGMLHTIEINDEITDFAQSFIEKSGLKDKITCYTGDALKIIPTLNIQFDLVFIDGEKNQYLEYYNLVIDKVKPGGFIIADNVLWSGKVVAETLKSNDHFTKGILQFNDFVHNDSRVQNVLVPLCDGLMLLRKI